MYDFIKMHIIIKVKNNEEKMAIGTKIHEQLRGNEDYVNNNIILNVDDPNMVDICIFEDCQHIPEITI